MDTSVLAMYQRKPLMAFSPVSDLQYQLLCSTADDFVTALRTSVSAPNTVNGPQIGKAYGLFWLWVLGAYEFTRTIRIRSNNHNLSIAPELHALEKRIKVLRIPMAKQELAGKPVHSWQSAMPWGLNPNTPDITFNVQGQPLSAMEMLADFSSTICRITFSDVATLVS